MNLLGIYTILVFGSSIFLIRRWHVLGMLLSTLYVWVAVTGAIKLFPNFTDWETREDWPALGWILTLIWSLAAFGVLMLIAWIKKALLQHHPTKRKSHNLE
ncbi:MAG: hypothetical protein ACTHMT_07750 [Verrucomicrobiota bacterium]